MIDGPDVRWERLDDERIRIPRHGAMRVDGLVFASDDLVRGGSIDTQSLRQVANVACLPGILGRSVAMPDIHWGYGFPIGGVAAFDPDDGVISPGGVGYDINCGVRLLRTDLSVDEVRPVLRDVVRAMFRTIPTGIGARGGVVALTRDELREVCETGAAFAAGRGLGWESDLDHVEERGRIAGADFGQVSAKAVERGRGQLGTLGSGNHFAEVGYVAQVDDPATAAAFGLFAGGVTVTIHTGSRGFGHQVCTDFIPRMDKAARAAGIELPDRQLACAPVGSPEGRAYFGAMACAANFAFANRQAITGRVREAFEAAMGKPATRLGMRVVYDVAHNIAKFEEHSVDGRPRRVCIHRKGATRALPAGHPQTPREYAHVGQPVLVPGDMGRASYVLVGLPSALGEAFGSSCHGAGRVLSRSAAIRTAKGRDIRREMEDAGIVVMAAGRETIAEEMPDAYKDVTQVVDVVHRAGIARKVALIRPIGVIKG
ncbi:MAG: RtcB family protein [Deltaproteobacteria bacterium]|nr:RtcB family protein [Deltaproteobacteria bacterium]